MKRAEELRNILNQNSVTIDKIYKQLDEAAKSGNNMITFFGYMPDEVFFKLIEDGFKISKFTGYTGENVLRIEF